MLDYTFEDTIDAPIEIVFDLISDLPNYKQLVSHKFYP